MIVKPLHADAERLIPGCQKQPGTACAGSCNSDQRSLPMRCFVVSCQCTRITLLVSFLVGSPIKISEVHKKYITFVNQKGKCQSIHFLH